MHQYAIIYQQPLHFTQSNESPLIKNSDQIKLGNDITTSLYSIFDLITYPIVIKRLKDQI